MSEKIREAYDEAITLYCQGYLNKRGLFDRGFESGKKAASAELEQLQEENKRLRCCGGNLIASALKDADNECTDSPYWLILDPKQNMTCEIGLLAHQITGPFFSREDAECHLKRRNYAYSKRATVFCLSGYWSDKYKSFYRSIKEVVE